ncbi:MAG: hypothetical protein ACRC1R_05625 [Cetobacterium sp.]|uniref:hypothetical protein n=1 Tax=Cetobacterium sp. TaxID=2071632 RepID=UPI003F385972
MIKKFLILILILSNTLFGNSDSIIAPKKYKSAEMNIEITKIKIKEIDGFFNFSTGEISIKKSNLEKVEKEDYLFLNSSPKNFTKLNFKGNPKENNDFYFFPINKNHKEKIYLIHSNKNNIKNIYRINKINPEDYDNRAIFYINNPIDFIEFEGFPGNDNFSIIGNYCSYEIIQKPNSTFPANFEFTHVELDTSKYDYKIKDIKNDITLKIFYKNTNKLILKLEVEKENGAMEIEGKIQPQIPKDMFRLFYRDTDINTDKDTPTKKGYIQINGQSDISNNIEVTDIDFGILPKTFTDAIAKGKVKFKGFGDKIITVGYYESNINLSHKVDNTINLPVILLPPEQDTNKHIFYLPAKASAVNAISGVYETIINLQVEIKDKKQGGKF